MKKIIFYFIIASFVFGETKKWDAHSGIFIAAKKMGDGAVSVF